MRSVYYEMLTEGTVSGDHDIRLPYESYLRDMGVGG